MQWHCNSIVAALKRLFGWRSQLEPIFRRDLDHRARAARTSAVIQNMQAQRLIPRSIDYLTLVARPTRDHYREVWRLEDQHLLDAEASRPRRRKR